MEYQSSFATYGQESARRFEMKYPRTILAALLVAMLAGCSRTVSWEEEVLLNTGDIIWLKRELVYHFQGAPGNPFDMGYRPDSQESLSFEWNGKAYRYIGEALIDLIAVSPLSGKPVLIANAGSNGWGLSNNYRCAFPYYVQFNFNETKQAWIYPRNIEKWAYDLPTNTMIYKPDVSRASKRYTINDKNTLDRVVRLQSPQISRIKSDHASAFNCTGEYK